jgi:hypothetical protein
MYSDRMSLWARILPRTDDTNHKRQRAVEVLSRPLSRTVKRFSDCDDGADGSIRGDESGGRMTTRSRAATISSFASIIQLWRPAAEIFLEIFER